MTDIAEALLSVQEGDRPHDSSFLIMLLCHEAADEIVRLRDEVKRMKGEPL